MWIRTSERKQTGKGGGRCCDWDAAAKVRRIERKFCRGWVECRIEEDLKTCCGLAAAAPPSIFRAKAACGLFDMPALWLTTLLCRPCSQRHALQARDRDSQQAHRTRINARLLLVNSDRAASERAVACWLSCRNYVYASFADPGRSGNSSSSSSLALFSCVCKLDRRSVLAARRRLAFARSKFS